eukprot:SAG11_NODE_4437_length_1894_cov_130.039554_2_plen_174_part_00
MKNVYYFDFVFPQRAGAAGGNHPENPGEITFPSMPQNIKANQVYISVDKLILQNLNGNSAHLNNFIINVQTSIPSANYYSAFFGDNTPRNTGYGETIPLLSSRSTNHLQVANLFYVNNNPLRHVLCANPFGNKYKVSFFQCNEPNGGRALNPTITDNIILTLRVELLEEEIFR